MSQRIRRAAQLGLLLILPLCLTAAKPIIGGQAPDMTLTLINGESISLADLRGQVVVLNFWATWCAPCKKELPLLDRYYEIQKPRGLRVFAITTEDSVPTFKLKKLFEVMKIPPVRKISGPYKVLGALPTNYVIDRSGRIRYAAASAWDLDELNKVLVPLLKEPAPAGY